MLESSEDYELVLLRLCAGEGGLVRTEPEEARARFAEEAGEPQSRPATCCTSSSTCVVSLRSEPLARALDPEPDPSLPYAPPSRPSRWPASTCRRSTRSTSSTRSSRRRPRGARRGTPRTSATVASAPHCLYCGDTLPGRPAGPLLPALRAAAGASECPRCHSEVEPGWRHCVSCGTALADG